MNLPKEITIQDYEVTVKVWKRCILVREFGKKCEASPFCEMIDCTFCLELLANIDHCFPRIGMIIIFLIALLACLSLYYSMKVINLLISLLRLIFTSIYKAVKGVRFALNWIKTKFKQRRNLRKPALPHRDYWTRNSEPGRNTSRYKANIFQDKTNWERTNETSFTHHPTLEATPSQNGSENEFAFTDDENTFRESREALPETSQKIYDRTPSEISKESHGLRRKKKSHPLPKRKPSTSSTEHHYELPRSIPMKKFTTDTNIAMAISVGIAITLFITIITPCQGCSESITLSAQRKACTMSKDQRMECIVTQVTRIALAPKGQDSCLLVQDPHSEPIGSLSLETKQIQLVCNPNNQYFTRNFKVETTSVKRCPTEGSCSGHSCPDISVDAKIDELGTDANSRPGYTYCSASCACAGCNCFFLYFWVSLLQILWKTNRW